jgi:hypothetical protein
MIVHADNAMHLAKCVTKYMDHNLLKTASHPPSSPDLAPSDFYFVGCVKHQLHEHDLTEGAELVLAISEILNQIPTHTLVDIFNAG